jgi:hypothetical protein
MNVPATPVATAAQATAGATHSSTRGSNGNGIRYSGPNFTFGRLYSRLTDSGTSSRASSARARVAAIFISSFTSVARASSAPRKMNGKPRTLFTWFG